MEFYPLKWWWRAIFPCILPFFIDFRTYIIDLFFGSTTRFWWSNKYEIRQFCSYGRPLRKRRQKKVLRINRASKHEEAGVERKSAMEMISLITLSSKNRGRPKQISNKDDDEEGDRRKERGREKWTFEKQAFYRRKHLSI